MTFNSSLSPLPLPEGVTEHQIPNTAAGLSFHILEAGYDSTHSRPLLLLLHGFPELAFSWRKVMPSLAAVGYYVVAVDQRGYGRTSGWDNSQYEDVDLTQFTLTNLVRDLVILTYALGYTSVACVVGHDFGAVSSSMCASIRPDLFRSCIMMSHPFHAPGLPPFSVAHSQAKDSSSSDSENNTSSGKDISTELAALSPPRKHYKWYNSTSSAASDWISPPQGLHAFLRGYIHLKSSSYSYNNPYPLAEWSAKELAKLPEYYIMPLSSTMPEVVAKNMGLESNPDQTTSWLPDSDLAVYVNEWTRTGFQGALNWYRSTTSEMKVMKNDMLLFAGKKIEVPAIFISGAQDWGNHQQPGAIEGLPKSCSDFRGVKLIEGAGHWPQQEQPERVVEEIFAFLKQLPSSAKA